MSKYNNSEETWIAIIVLVGFFIAILLVFRKMIKYPFCSLENYSGKYGRGISNYYFIIHLIASLGISLVCFFFLNNNRSLETFFDNTILRLGTILLLWMFWALGIGWLIELYLENTDKEYKQWKTEQQNK